MRCITIVSVLILMGVVNIANATVDYLAVNHVTKEIHVYDEEAYRGVFWVSVAGEAWNEKEIYYSEHGYAYTKHPYKIDIFLGCLLVYAIGFVSVRLIRRS